ncbi:Uncharacterised protein [Mycobacteroides abscessus]|nr:Uncharacterised protein [Mycobacteroides abscessus]
MPSTSMRPAVPEITAVFAVRDHSVVESVACVSP